MGAHGLRAMVKLLLSGTQLKYVHTRQTQDNSNNNNTSVIVMVIIIVCNSYSKKLGFLGFQPTKCIMFLQYVLSFRGFQSKLDFLEIFKIAQKLGKRPCTIVQGISSRMGMARREFSFFIKCTCSCHF